MLNHLARYYILTRELNVVLFVEHSDVVLEEGEEGGGLGAG